MRDYLFLLIRAHDLSGLLGLKHYMPLLWKLTFAVTLLTILHIRIAIANPEMKESYILHAQKRNLIVDRKVQPAC